MAFVEALAGWATAPATLYLVGGATAVTMGWRASTIDIDLVLRPEDDGALRALPRLKEELGIDVELASPLDFLPELPHWEERSPFVAQVGPLTVRQFDPYSQALAKLERGFSQDRADVAAMIERGLVEIRGSWSSTTPSPTSCTGSRASIRSVCAPRSRRSPRTASDRQGVGRPRPIPPRPMSSASTCC